MVNELFYICSELFDVEKNENYGYTENENYRYMS